MFKKFLTVYLLQILAIDVEQIQGSAHIFKLHAYFVVMVSEIKLNVSAKFPKRQQ